MGVVQRCAGLDISDIHQFEIGMPVIELVKCRRILSGALSTVRARRDPFFPASDQDQVGL